MECLAGDGPAGHGDRAVVGPSGLPDREGAAGRQIDRAVVAVAGESLGQGQGPAAWGKHRPDIVFQVKMIERAMAGDLAGAIVVDQVVGVELIPRQRAALEVD
jgi:hypothetical protein